METRIRPFKKEDAPPAARLIAECFRKLDLGGHTARGLELQIANNSPSKLIEKSEAVNLFVAEEKDRVLGICGYDNTKIHTFFVDVGHQKRGVGRLLLDRVLDEAKKDGLKAITTWSTMYAQTYYEKYGFVVKKEIHLPEGTDDIVLIEMERKL